MHFREKFYFGLKQFVQKRGEERYSNLLQKSLKKITSNGEFKRKSSPKFFILH